MFAGKPAKPAAFPVVSNATPQDVEGILHIINKVSTDVYDVPRTERWWGLVRQQLHGIIAENNPLRRAAVLKDATGNIVGGFIIDNQVTVLADKNGHALRLVHPDYRPKPGEKILLPGSHHVLYLQAAFIDEAYRRQGTAQKLLKDAMTGFRQQGVTTLLSNARPMSKTLLEKYGFQTVSGPQITEGEKPEYATHWMRLDF